MEQDGWSPEEPKHDRNKRQVNILTDRHQPCPSMGEATLPWAAGGGGGGAGGGAGVTHKAGCFVGEAGSEM